MLFGGGGGGGDGCGDDDYKHKSSASKRSNRLEHCAMVKGGVYVCAFANDGDDDDAASEFTLPWRACCAHVPVANNAYTNTRSLRV